MAGNLAKSHLYVLILKRRFIAEMFSTLSAVRLGFHLNCARLAVHYFAVYSVLGSFYKSKPQRQRQRVQRQCGKHAL